MGVLAFVFNIFWICTGGWFCALVWFMGAALCAISVVGAPMVRPCINLARMSFAPMGKDVVSLKELRAAKGEDQTGLGIAAGVAGTVFNIIWLVLGVPLFCIHLLFGAVSCVTIIGIPFGIANFRIAGAALWPIGRRVVKSAEAKVIREAAAKAKLGIA